MRSLGLILLVTALAGAQPATQRGRAIADQALAALGGAKYMSMTNRVEQGRLYSFYREQLNGLATARVYTKYEKPGTGQINIRERQSFGKKEEDYAYLFTDTEGVQISFRGIRPLPAGQYERYIDTMMHNIFYILRYRMDELGMIFEFKETAVFDNNPVEIVDITDGENRSVTVYFHRTTHMPIRQVFYRRDPDSKRRIEETTVYNKYRDIGGVKWPWSIVRFRDGNKIFEMYSEHVAVNDPKIDDKVFAPPANAKRLKPD
ncbi:MAG: hypothetical protein HYX27_19030 [Acidobacteria bacterium]|nr:hypothetical protein [Acidobacteriota bacterium]